MNPPIPGVLYQRIHPDRTWRAKGRPPLSVLVMPTDSLFPSDELFPIGDS